MWINVVAGGGGGGTSPSNNTFDWNLDLIPRGEDQVSKHCSDSSFKYSLLIEYQFHYGLVNIKRKYSGGHRREHSRVLLKDLLIWFWFWFMVASQSVCRCCVLFPRQGGDRPTAVWKSHPTEEPQKPQKKPQKTDHSVLALLLSAVWPTLISRFGPSLSLVLMKRCRCC